jgi:hypothetical protein
MSAFVFGFSLQTGTTPINVAQCHDDFASNLTAPYTTSWRGVMPGRTSSTMGDRQLLLDDLARAVACSEWKLLSRAAWRVMSSPTRRLPKRRPWPLSTLTASAAKLCVIAHFDSDDLARCGDSELARRRRLPLPTPHRGTAQRPGRAFRPFPCPQRFQPHPPRRIAATILDRIHRWARENPSMLSSTTNADTIQSNINIIYIYLYQLLIIVIEALPTSGRR